MKNKYLETERAAVVKVDLETVVISSPRPLDRVCPASQNKQTGNRGIVSSRYFDNFDKMWDGWSTRLM